ncbi:RNB domain-containing ribonuclease [Sphingomonas daechungensis]|uniref:RNB domain-containing ribonuclease n=1 Tax=Sphingomonas daechungensis TaxID=1176646 RepID=UPI0037837E01
MRTIVDRNCLLGHGLALIRQQFQLPGDFPAEVLAEAEAVARRPIGEHADATQVDFVTLDPAQSRDLDQAFAIEAAGSDLLLHYAIADVGWFVAPGSALDREAWLRGTSYYLPDGKVPLYPSILCEGAVSLLPDGERAAVVFTVRVDQAGEAKLDGMRRARIRSRAKLAYETVREDELPAGFAELTDRVEAAELARRAARVEPPEQEVVQDNGHFQLQLRPQSWAERKNAALSLATNLAVADALLQAKTGLFRTMGKPQDWAVKRLRHTARALGLDWPKPESLEQLERRLDPERPADAAMMLAIRRASPAAGYEPYRDGVKPWHAAVAATYAHATAPLRRLADRYVVEAALAVANGQPAADPGVFERLPDVMQKADALSGQIAHAVIDLAEAVVLTGREGSTFDAVVTDVDERGARIQICSPAIVARIKTDGLKPGDALRVRLDSADAERRTVQFSIAS